jgi:hypothetical protein
MESVISHKLEYFAELSPSIASLQVFIWSKSIKLDPANYLIQYKCDNGKLKIVITDKLTSSKVLKIKLRN